MSRCAGERRVLFVEEPIFGDGSARFVTEPPDPGVTRAVPHLPEGPGADEAVRLQRRLLRQLLRREGIESYVLRLRVTPPSQGQSL